MAIGKQTLRSLIALHDHDRDYLRRGISADASYFRAVPGPRVLLSWVSRCTCS